MKRRKKEKERGGKDKRKKGRGEGGRNKREQNEQKMSQNVCNKHS